MGFPVASHGKESSCSAEDPGLIPGLGRFPGEGNSYPLQYPCLENPMDRGASRDTVHGVAKSWTQLSELIYNVLVSDLQQNDLKASSIIGYYKILSIVFLCYTVSFCGLFSLYIIVVCR